MIANDIQNQASWANKRFKKLENSHNKLCVDYSNSERAEQELREQSIVRDLSETFIVYFLYQNREDTTFKRFIEFDQVYGDFLNVNLPSFYNAFQRTQLLEDRAAAMEFHESSGRDS